MAVTWSNPTLGVGWIIALVVLLITVILAALKLIELPVALVVVSICAVRL